MAYSTALLSAASLCSALALHTHQQHIQTLAGQPNNPSFGNHSFYDVRVFGKTDAYDDELAKAELPVRLWDDLDNIVKSHHFMQSGGIFLDKVQAPLLSQLIQKLSQSRSPKKLRVCETGFGAGHSAALWLASDPNVVVTSFDLFDRPYQKPAARFLKDLYPGRLETVEGNSCVTLPKYLEACDFIHASSLCRTDDIDFVLKQPCGTILTATAMNSLYDRQVYFGKGAQWAALVKNQCIRDVMCFEEEPFTLAKDYVFGHANLTVQQSFCMAITSGRCVGSVDNQTQPVAEIMGRSVELRGDHDVEQCALTPEFANSRGSVYSSGAVSKALASGSESWIHLE